MNEAERKKHYILIVEKNIDDRFLTSMLLQRFGYNTFGSGSATEAVEFMLVAPPAAVFAEAGATSSTLVYRMKKAPGFADIPVIFMAAPSDSAPQDSALGAVIRKPINAEELYRVIQSVVEKTPRRNIRIATSLPANVEDAYGGKGELVTVLSENGMFIRTGEPRTIGKIVPVTFELRGRTIRLEAVVLYTTELGEGPFREPGMGMKFTKLGPEDTALIREFILADVHEELAPKKPEIF